MTSLKEKINTELEQLPTELKEVVLKKIALYAEKAETQSSGLSKQKDVLASIPKVWVSSDFISASCIRKPELLDDLIVSGDLLSSERRSSYGDHLNAKTVNNETDLMVVLRQFRCREMVRIAWRDLAGWSDLDETLADLSLLAEVCIEYALNYLYTTACELRGVPTNSEGKAINIVVLGMGKLGAWELNYSSDIDLIFAYEEDGELNDRKQTSYGEFFSRICRNLVKVLDQITAEGFVFRTDVRLRPFGDSGPIIMTFQGMEHYYLTQAREWERYAMIKARQVAGDFESGKYLSGMIKPFIYRRYLDYGAFDELRNLKAMITQELRRKDRMENIKLGPGGIREIEFIGQAFQLIRGGQNQQLQERRILKILQILGEMQLLTRQDADQLQTSYCFLRRVENHIQQYQDKQTHDLPTDPLVRQILAYSLNYESWEDFILVLDKVRTAVHEVFEQVFSITDEETSRSPAELIWLDDDSSDGTTHLEQLGFKQAEQSYKALLDFKQSRAIERLTAKGAKVIDRLIPQLIEAVNVADNIDQTFKRILDLFEQVAGRNVYLSLLSENPKALTQLIRLSSASPWICQYLTQYPVLFDELLDTRSLYEPLKKQQLKEQLELSLDNIEDIEQIMIKLRQFKHLNVLRIAASDIMGKIPVSVVSDYLTDVAEVILEYVITKTWQTLTDKHGLPPGTSDDNKAFAVLGFGKLGGFELGYGSDLDMVFLYDCQDGNAMTHGGKALSTAQFYGRLGQKIRHMLDTKMLSGLLYEVDMRLRPSGDSGLLVTHISVYEDYLKNSAWTWEHQALIRGRYIAGDDDLQKQYQGIRQRVLSMPREINNLQKEICEMRDKMRVALAPKEKAIFDLKHSIGGIVDIEFIVQFHILAHASENEGLTNYTDNARLLEALSQFGLISESNAELLKKAYFKYRDFGHHQVLKGERAVAKEDDFVEIRSQVEQIWHEAFRNAHGRD